MRFPIKRLAFLSFLVTFVPLAFNFSTPLIVQQASAQNPNSTQTQVNQLLQLKGIQEPQIQLLRGISVRAEPIRKDFQGSKWRFYPNGKFTFTPQSGPAISGTYSKIGENFEFQGVHFFEGIKGISLDGTIHVDGDKLVLDVLYTNSGSLSKPQQIARISQLLVKDSAILETKPIQSSEASAGTERATMPDDLGKNTEQLELDTSSATKEIEGIKIPRNFTISVEGTINAGSFGPIPGTLYIGESKAGDQNPLSVSLMTSPDFFDNNGEFFLFSDDPNKKIKVNNGQIRIEYMPSETMRGSGYTVSLSGTSNKVSIEKGIVTLSIVGERISGEIHLSGMTGEYLNQPSTYEAKLIGEIPKSPPVEKLRSALTTSSFNGQWDAGASGFGRIELQKNGQQVSGTYTGRGGGTIQGTLRGNRLDFTWQDHQQGKGWGFFRAMAGGGTLAGVWGTGTSRSNGQSLVATWQIPSFLATETFSLFDMEELQNLGNELALKSRCEQAVPFLNKVMNFYQKQQQNPDLEESAVINSGSSLHLLIRCNLQIENYENLLANLDYGLEIKRILGPDESASRLFRQNIADLTKKLNHNVQLFTTMESAYRNLQKDIEQDRVMIGISLEENKESKELIVSSTMQNFPAQRAGILPGDVVVKIDGKTTQGMALQQALESFKGKPETFVELTVRRGNQELNYQLIRARVGVTSAQRRIELVQTLKFFADYHKSLAARLAATQAKLTTLEKRIAQGQENPVEALLSVAEDLKNQKAQLDTETQAVIAKGREVFKEQKEIIQELDSILLAFEPVSKSPEAIYDIKVKELNARDERLIYLVESNNQLSPGEKFFFIKQYYFNIFLLTGLATDMEIQRNDISRRDVKKEFEENRESAQESAANFADFLEIWRIRLINDIDKIEALEQGQPFFQKVVKFLTSLSYHQEALVASEKSRARAFADLLTAKLSSSSKPGSGADEPTIEQIKQIAKQQNATLVEYAITDDKFQVQGKEQTHESELYIWVIKPTGEVTFRKVDLKPLWQQQNTSLSDLVTTSRESIGVRGHSLGVVAKVNEATSTQRLQQLHQLLIQPIADLLPTDPNSRVIFIPQTSLFLVPFPALPDKDGKYLIEKHTILTSPAIQVLDLTHKQLEKLRSAGVKDAIVVGNPIMPSVPSAPGETPQQLPSLPGAEKEAEAIALLLHTKPLIGKDATKTAIEQLMPNARIIHLATHGLLDDERGIESAIALTPSGKDDGLFTASQILNLKLNAELVVLSACNTGRGRITGDGVIGLSRSLISAGTSSVMVSLWSVPDAPTAFLMTEFYKNLQQNPDKAQALRQAMLTTMKQNPNPKDWAAFTLIGEP